MSTGNELWHIQRAEDNEECMFIPVEEKDYHQCCEDQPEELDAEAEQQNFGTLDKSPFNGSALNTSEGLQEQSNDEMISAVTLGQESVEMTSDLCTEETPNGSADKAVRDDHEIMHTRDDYDMMCTATDTTAGKGNELSSSTESAFTNPNSAIGAADETVTCSQISKESTANYTALNTLDKDKQNHGSEMSEAKNKASSEESRQYKLPENKPCPKSKKKERKAESDMKQLLEYQGKLAQKINARRFEHQLKEMQMMADGSYEIPESPLDKRLRRIDEEIALIKALMDLVKSLTVGEEDHNMSLTAIETIEALKGNFTPSVLLKYPVVIIFHSIRRYANNEKIRSKGEKIYSLFDAMFPKDGFEDFLYAFERAMKIYQERFVKDEQFSRKIINRMCVSVGKNGRSAFTVESWNALQAERYSSWNQFFQAYDKPKESTVKQGEKKKSVKADVKKVEAEFDDVKNNDLPKGRLQGRKRGRPTSTITKEDLCKVEPKVEEKKFKILKEEDTKPDVKSVAELPELKQSSDLSLVKIKEEVLENDEKSVVFIKTEVLSDNKDVRDVKGKGRKQPGRKSKQGNQNGRASTIEQKTTRKCHSRNSAEN